MSARRDRAWCADGRAVIERMIYRGARELKWKVQILVSKCRSRETYFPQPPPRRLAVSLAFGINARGVAAARSTHSRETTAVRETLCKCGEKRYRASQRAIATEIRQSGSARRLSCERVARKAGYRGKSAYTRAIVRSLVHESASHGWVCRVRIRWYSSWQFAPFIETMKIFLISLLFNPFIPNYLTATKNIVMSISFHKST